MSEHVAERLGAYLDGELRGSRLQRVEEHLAGCPACQAELQALRSLSAMLREVPAPEFTPSERFAARVALRLPRGLPASAKSKAWDVGWWLIPVGLLTVWGLISTTLLVRKVVSTANEFGVLNTAPAWLVSGSPDGAYWSGALGDFGLLSGSTLEWAEMTEAVARHMLPQITWQGSIALVYLAWIAVWWARHTLQEHSQSLEG